MTGTLLHQPAKLSPSFHKFGNVFPTPSPGPPRLVKAPAAATLSREGRGLDYSIPILPTEPQPSPLAGEGARGTRAGEGLTPTTKEVAYVSVVPKGSTRPPRSERDDTSCLCMHLSVQGRARLAAFVLGHPSRTTNSTAPGRVNSKEAFQTTHSRSVPLPSVAAGQVLPA